MSGKRKEILANGEIYHVFNKSIADGEIFTKNRDLKRAMDLLEYYKYPQTLRYSFFKRLHPDAKNEYDSQYKKGRPIIDLYCYALMPNHFHFLIKQIQSEGIKIFLSNFQNSFAKFYNLKYKRKGSLFLKPFKARRIENDGLFLHISRYIHLNPVTSYLIEYEELKNYPWNSFHSYLNQEPKDLVNKKVIIKLAGSKDNYEKFVANRADYQRKLRSIKYLTLE